MNDLLIIKLRRIARQRLTPQEANELSEIISHSIPIPLSRSHLLPLVCPTCGEKLSDQQYGEWYEIPADIKKFQCCPYCHQRYRIK